MGQLGGLWLVMVLGGSDHDSGLQNDRWCDSLLVGDSVFFVFYLVRGLV